MKFSANYSIVNRKKEGRVDRENKRSEDFKQSVPKWIFIVDVLTMEWIRTKIIQNTYVNYVLEQELSPLMSVPNEIRNCVYISIRISI